MKTPLELIDSEALASPIKYGAKVFSSVSLLEWINVVVCS